MLTKNQKTVLEIIFASELKDFATWGGGTALSEIYLHHRQSDDIDIILSDLPVGTYLTAIANQIETELGADSRDNFSKMNRFQYFFNLKPKNQLKLEFVYYPFPRLDKPKKDGKILVESLYDLAVSKTLAGYQRKEPKDAYDLYEILKRKLYSLNKLVVGVEKKFGEKIDTALLLANLTDSSEMFDAIKPLLVDKNITQKALTALFQEEFKIFQTKNKL